MKTKVSIIVAMTPDRVIGNKGELPWRQQADLERFRALTTDHNVIMGRKTFDSIGHALPNRTNIVITSNYTGTIYSGVDQHTSIIKVKSFDKALWMADDQDEVFIIGGASVYKQAIEHADYLYITTVMSDKDGDTKFPEWSQDNTWELVEEPEFHKADKNNEFNYKYEIFEIIRRNYV